ncbi:hypothetical protein EJB05_40911 [Eragrostis curvula]|uniref:GDSL esterase/lipase n=1 Tax=Eragrostis curvula TaxID=38414 RepID=A0A5J9T7Z3_9POAL|nr:hypothetical protein EJB05_40911 [Eragrostis curvula]
MEGRSRSTMGFELAMIKALVVSLVLGSVAGVRPGKIVPQVPAMYVFGDSTLDVGNNNHLPGKDVPRADKPYYGIDLPGSGKPTGRFSNGYNMADFVAQALGFPKSPLACLELKARNYLIPSAINRGVSYASAGSGILDSTNAGGNIPLSEQVRYFESTKAEMVAEAGSGAVSQLLSKSFFLLGTGSNDLFAFWTQKNGSASQSEVDAFINSLISSYSATITALHELGARKFGIINVGPVGCVPRVRVLSATGECTDGLNQLAAGFDAALNASLVRSLLGLRYSVADSLGLATTTDPAAAGFVNTDSACCGAGRLGAEGDCSMLNSSNLCPNRDIYLFWDPVHPSQRAAMISAQTYYDGPAQFTTPINFKQLALQS